MLPSSMVSMPSGYFEHTTAANEHDKADESSAWPFAASSASVVNAGFNAIDIVHLAALSRLTERLRFTVGPSLLDEEVTLENLKDAFREHERMVIKQFETSADDDAVKNMMISREHSIPSVGSNMASSVEYLDDTTPFKQLETIWNSIQKQHSKELSVTYGFLFDYEFPLFPETTLPQRERLVELSQQEVISRGDVAACLGCAVDDASVNFFFASGVDLLPSEVFKDLVDSIDQHPTTLSFARTFTERAARIAKIRIPLFLHLLLSIVLIVQTQTISVREHYVVQHNMRHWIANDWSTGCPNGPFAECNVVAKTLFTIERPEMDALRYLRSELIGMLWKGNNFNVSTGRREPFVDPSTLGTLPLGGVFPVGALLMRLVVGHHYAVFSQNQTRCNELNVSRTIYHFEIPVYYGCDALWSIMIPFNATREKALEMASAVTLPPDDDHLYGIITQFTGYQPSTGLLVHARVVLSFPGGGGVAHRLLISPIDTDQEQNLLPILILAVVVTAFQIITAIRHYRAGLRVIDWPFVLDLISFVIIAAAYGLMRSIPTTTEVLQVEYFAPGIDSMADWYDAAMSLLGFYTLVQIGGLIRFAKELKGLDLLFRILDDAAPKILGLVVVYIVWSLGFVCVGMLLFGPNVEEFSSFGKATQALILFFFGEAEFEMLVDNNPVTGPLFFFSYKLFVTFFALHLLIAAITGPVHHINKTSVMLKQIMVAVRSRMANATFFERALLTVHEYLVWPLVPLLLDSCGVTHSHWLSMFRVVDSFYGNIQNIAFPDAISAAKRLTLTCAQLHEVLQQRTAANKARFAEELTQLDSPTLGGTQADALFESMAAIDAQEFELWDSPLMRTVIKDQRITNDIALALVLVTIASETRFTVVRDARLVQALTYFEEFSAGIAGLNHLQEGLKTEIKAQSQPLHFQVYSAGLERRDEAVERHAGVSLTANGILSRIAAEDLAEKRRLILERRKQVVKATNPLEVSSGLDVSGGTGSVSPRTKDLSKPDRRTSFINRRQSVISRKRLSTSKQPQRGMESSVLEGSVRRDTSEGGFAVEAAPEVHDESELRSTFFELYGFTQLLRLKFGNATRFTMYTCVAIGLTIWYLSSFITAFEPTAHLSDALKRGFEKAEQLTRCYDSECKEGFLFNKTFMDLEDMDEFQHWVEYLLKPQLFHRRDKNLTGADRGAIWFDPRITLTSPVAIRQLRGSLTPCQPFIWSATLPHELQSVFYEERRKELDRYTCATGTPRSTAGFDTTPIPFSPLGPPTLFNADAYQYQTTCAEKEPKDYAGKFGDYPCEGYTAYINSSAALDELLRLRFLDNMTRLVAITANFNQGARNAVEYTMLLELGENGGGCTHRAFIFPLKSTSTLSDLTQEKITTMVVIALHLLSSGVFWLRYWFFLFVKKLPADQLGMYRPEKPWFILLLSVTVFVVFPIFIPSSSQSSRNTLAHAIVGVIYLMYLLTSAVVFPVASLISKEVHTLVTVLEKAVLQILYVVPYFFLFIGAFTLSGFVLFSRFSVDFSRVRWAFQTVALQGFTEELTIGQWQLARPFEAQVWAMLFFIIMLVVLANLFLAMVTSATDQAHHTDPAVALAEATVYYHGTEAKYGKFLSMYIAWSELYVQFRHRFFDPPTLSVSHDQLSMDRSTAIRPSNETSGIRTDAKRPRRYDSVILTYQGRLLFPSETLCAVLPPLRVNTLLKMFDRLTTNKVVLSSVIPYFITNFQRFKRENAHQAAIDARLQVEEEELYAEGREAGFAFVLLHGRERRRAEKIERMRPEFRAQADLNNLGPKEIFADMGSSATDNGRRKGAELLQSASKSAARSDTSFESDAIVVVDASGTAMRPGKPPPILVTEPDLMMPSFQPRRVSEANSAERSPLIAARQLNPEASSVTNNGDEEQPGGERLEFSAVDGDIGGVFAEPERDAPMRASDPEKDLWVTTDGEYEKPTTAPTEPPPRAQVPTITHASPTTSWDTVIQSLAERGKEVPLRLMERLLSEGDPPEALCDLIALMLPPPQDANAARESFETASNAGTTRNGPSGQLGDSPKVPDSPTPNRNNRRVKLTDTHELPPSVTPETTPSAPRSAMRRTAASVSSVGDDDEDDTDAPQKKKVDRASAARRWTSLTSVARATVALRSPSLAPTQPSRLGVDM